MPRKARIDAPGALHHIICRGIERRLIFREDFDRRDFVKRLGTILTETQTPCYAWSLMPNHFHLLLRTGSVPIASVMRRLLTGYAGSFNRRYRRHGHLFQNRYKSILCQEDAYLLNLVRYIHLNPLRAHVVESIQSLDEYEFCGHKNMFTERLLRVGPDAQSLPPADPHGPCPCFRCHAQAADGIRRQFQPTLPAPWTSFSEPLQVDPLPGRCLPPGTGALYPLEPIASAGCGFLDRTG